MDHYALKKGVIITTALNIISLDASQASLDLLAPYTHGSNIPLVFLKIWPLSGLRMQRQQQ
jgi:hypothetical protein